MLNVMYSPKSCLGTGFDIRNRSQQDVDDDVDVDGEDEVLYGAAQFTEGDILVVETARPGMQNSDGDSGVQVDDDDSVDVDMEAVGPVGMQNKSLRDLVAEGKVVKRRESGADDQEVKKTMDEVMGVGEAEEIDKSIELARLSGNPSMLITVLENKIQLLVCVSGLTLTCLADSDRVHVGINKSFVFYIAALSYMYRPLHGADGVNWLLAYVLQRMLVKVSRLH